MTTRLMDMLEEENSELSEELAAGIAGVMYLGMSICVLSDVECADECNVAGSDTVCISPAFPFFASQTITGLIHVGDLRTRYDSLPGGPQTCSRGT